MRSLSVLYMRGLVDRRPVLAPVVVRRSIELPSNIPPTLPLLARNSLMIFSFQLSGVLSDMGSPSWFVLNSLYIDGLHVDGLVHYEQYTRYI